MKASDETARLKRILSERSEFRRKLLLSSHISRSLTKEKVEVVLVGGAAIEIYTAGQFLTGDIDIVVSDSDKAIRLLKSLGFRREGRVWVSEKLGAAIDIVASSLSDSRQASGKIRTIKVDSSRLNVAGPEDLIVARLVSAKYWKASVKTDLEQAAALLLVSKDLDKSYLRKRVKEEKVDDVFRKLQRKLSA